MARLHPLAGEKLSKMATIFNDLLTASVVQALLLPKTEFWPDGDAICAVEKADKTAPSTLTEPSVPLKW